MGLLEATIRQAAQIKDKVAKKNKYEYDSDEEMEGGTWEHKKRREEMKKTLGSLSCGGYAYISHVFR